MSTHGFQEGPPLTNVVTKTLLQSEMEKKHTHKNTLCDSPQSHSRLHNFKFPGLKTF